MFAFQTSLCQTNRIIPLIGSPTCCCHSMKNWFRRTKPRLSIGKVGATSVNRWILQACECLHPSTIFYPSSSSRISSQTRRWGSSGAKARLHPGQIATLKDKHSNADTIIRAPSESPLWLRLFSRLINVFSTSADLFGRFSIKPWVKILSGIFLFAYNLSYKSTQSCNIRRASVSHGKRVWGGDTCVGRW